LHYQRILNLLGAEVKMPVFPFTDPYATRRGQNHSAAIREALARKKAAREDATP
jgi:hypothetical protein